MLKEEGKISDEIITKLMKWRHSGFKIENCCESSETMKTGRDSVA
jgi:hypothetical protein